MPRPGLIQDELSTRLTVMRHMGKLKLEFWMAARTCSRASCIAVSGRPTMRKLGIPPGGVSTSTSALASPLPGQPAVPLPPRRFRRMLGQSAGKKGE
jgi:hypothetical protein